MAQVDIWQFFTLILAFMLAWWHHFNDSVFISQPCSQTINWISIISFSWLSTVRNDHSYVWISLVWSLQKICTSTWWCCNILCMLKLHHLKSRPPVYSSCRRPSSTSSWECRWRWRMTSDLAMTSCLTSVQVCSAWQWCRGRSDRQCPDWGRSESAAEITLTWKKYFGVKSKLFQC